ncbi:trace amine-associated receptor 6-like [Hoplias malabaricus]|uniref:trace amine-associated receptor 6-like n=1 Tax=Hoplias malabaricus TaxID=27720 RepID=UPI00346331A9
MTNTDYRQNITVQYCFPDENSSCRKEVRTGSAYIFLFIVLSCISVCTVFLNLLVIISISHFKQLHTPTNLLILSLAVADLFVGLIVMPGNIMQLIDTCWYLGKLTCSIFPLVSSLSVLASVFSLVLIAVDQYIAVCDPLLYPSKVTFCKMSICIIICWSFCLLYNLIILYYNDHLVPDHLYTTCYGECVLVVKYSWVIIDLVISFLTPCSIILIMYGLIFKVARHQAKAIRSVTNGACHKNGSKVSGFSQRKAAKKVGTIIFAYVASWIPYYLSSLSAESLTTASMVWTVFTWVFYINSSVNPLLYSVFYSWFRASVKYIITCRIFELSSSRFNLYSEHS